jgi:cysteinyl-tRNA synthetase
MDLYLYNSLTKQKELFTPIDSGEVKLYTCGPTVYDYAHIGHGRKYLMDDILRRTLEYNGFKVNHVQNVTDVGHLVSDADDGEDKLEKGAKKQGKTVWEVAEFFTKSFYESMDALNFLRPTTICKATDHIKEQIELIEKLFKNGYAYDTVEAVYFDTSRFEDYGKMFGQKIEDKKLGVRSEVKTDENKKNNADFALWFKRVGKFVDHTMHWESPWGDGFPGWHIECSAMSMKYLGEQMDIHTGGEDHLSIHHPNEIAQSEGATGKKPFSKFWMHNAFLTVDGTKMSKSLGNFYTISDVVEKGFDPIALRYLFLGAHYKKPMNFTWQSLESASKGLKRLQSTVNSLRSTDRTTLSEEKNEKIEEFRIKFNEAINDDLNTSKAMAVMFDMLKSNIPSEDKYDLATSFDEVLGLGLKV